MSSETLYEHQLLQINSNNIEIENRTLAYEEIISTDIYKGRPFKIHGIMGLILLIPYSLTLLFLNNLLPSLGIIPILLLIPELLMIGIGFGIKSQYLYVVANDEKTPLLNHKSEAELIKVKAIVDRQILEKK